MKLPKLPDLNKDSNNDEVNNNSHKESVTRKRPRIPKSQYEEDGTPVLMIPDLNDIQLTEEIEKYFGEYEEEEKRG